MDASLESKAMTLLETYNGGNNYIIELKRKSQINKRFYPTRSQSEYIINNHDKQPKVAKKWVILDAYFAQKLADDKLMTEIPEKVWVEKLLADKEKAFHIWGKVTESEQLHDFWLPKAAIIKDNTVKDVVINYEKYSHRPPLEFDPNLCYLAHYFPDDEVVGPGAVGSATQRMAQPGEHDRDKGFLGTFFSGMASFLGKSNPDYSVGEIKDIMDKVR